MITQFIRNNEIQSNSNASVGNSDFYNQVIQNSVFKENSEVISNQDVIQKVGLSWTFFDNLSQQNQQVLLQIFNKNSIIEKMSEYSNQNNYNQNST